MLSETKMTSSNETPLTASTMYTNTGTIDPVVTRFALCQETCDELSQMEPEFGFNGLGKVVFQRTYSRPKPDGTNEDWGDVVRRVINGVMSIRKDHMLRNSLRWVDEEWQEYAHDMAVSMFKMEWLPPGRGLWMMGTEYCYERGGMSLYNCAATTTSDDLVHAAEWAMDSLMNGVGVGFDTSWRGTAVIPNKSDSMNYVVADSREGWVGSLIALLCSYVESSTYKACKYPVFDYSLLRDAGSLIKGFGGTASGYEPLKKLHVRVETYLDCFVEGMVFVDGNPKPYGHTRLVADIFNAIGACVVAGNVRRSAEIMLGDVDDETFLDLKNYEANPERGDIAWMSNNSVRLKANENFKDFHAIPKLAQRIIDNGEPGMINLHNIQNFGRTGKPMKDEATLINPCAEIPLCSKEVCNLSEVFPPRCDGPAEFLTALQYGTFYSSTVSLHRTHRVETNRIIAKNRRIGVSISGIAQWASMASHPMWGDMNYTAMTEYLRDGYKVVVDANRELAKEAGVPESIRKTTVKPSGSISLLAGCTPGVHYPVSRYAIRRVRVGIDSPVVPALKAAGVPHELDTYSDNTLCFEFAIDHGDIRPCEEVSPWEQFSVVAMLQRCYVDNSVSSTIYFDKDKDGPDVEKMLAMYIPLLKSVSMLPHSGHGYAQAPYEPITEERYEELRNAYKDPDFSTVALSEPSGSKFCSGDRCEV